MTESAGVTLLEAILLGAVQGVTEFLPISSDGHLVLMQRLLGIEGSQLFFDVMIHLGTLGAVVAVYRAPLAAIVAKAFGAVANSGFWRRPVATVTASPELSRLWLMFLASMPTALIGLLGEDWAEEAFGRPRTVGWMLLLNGLVLLLPRLPWLRRAPAEQSSPLKAWHALLIGAAQGAAIAPGLSRSGSTISIALLCGVRPAAAAEFSFLLSIPAILGAVALKLSQATPQGLSALSVAVGIAVSFAVGYGALRLLILTLRRGRFSLFSYYCFAVGGLTLLLL